MRNKIFLLLLIFLFNSCKNDIKILNILTNDILLYEIVDNFNLNSHSVKVKIDYINELNIFDFVQKNSIKNYDIICGFYFLDTIIDNKNYSKIDIYLDNENVFNYIKESYKNNKFYLTYSVDFPVIVARKDKINSKSNEISIEEFIQYVRTNNVKKEKVYESMLSFSSLLSNFPYTQYYFLFDIFSDKNSSNFYFDTQNLKNAFVFSTEFDNKYNYGKEFTDRYMEKYKNIDKNFFLKKGIIYFDFENFSEIFNIDKENFNIYLIKNLPYPSLSQKIITIRENSFLKREALEFIRYFIDKNNQERIMNASFNMNTDKKHIPIYKDLLKLNITKNDIPIQYIDNFKSIKFYNSKIQYNFFQILKNENQNHDFINMSEEKFILYFFEKINK